MGQVYRATDTTLSRQVAIKILPDAFASDPERLARFEREAKTLASLNHPNIAAIYAVEKSAGMTALVMESRATTCRSALPGARFLSTKHSRSRGKSRTHSNRRTSRGSFIVISNRRTSRSGLMARSRFWTSGWRRRLAPTAERRPLG